MQELYELIRQRFESVMEVTKQHLPSERVKVLKEQQKSRCQKQNFIVSMMRVNSKSIQMLSKSSYYKYSYQIMKKINPEFIHEFTSNKLQQNFLNDFVGLYKHFFYKYEEIFNFKLKLQNLIRPTNHNLPIDLVKYLVDFSRDYYQQTFIWYMKSLNKVVEKIDEDRQSVVKDEMTLGQKLKKEPQQTLQDQRSIMTLKRITRTSLNEITLQRSSSKKCEDLQSSIKKDPIKNYDVLDIVGWPSLMAQTKEMSSNVQIFKIRLNDLYREMKSRNNVIKSTFYNYSKLHPEKNDTKNKDNIEVDDESVNKATYPFKLTLVIQKNGFNYISIIYCEGRYQSKAKEKRLEPLKINQRIVPIMENKLTSDYLLTSLKIIRFSQNFLPPILFQPASLTSNNSINIPILQINTRSNLMSSNSATNHIQEQPMKKNKAHSIYHATQANPLIDAKILKEKSYRKLTELKRNFRSEEKRDGGIIVATTVNIGSPNDPQKKIYDWLEKLRQIKEIERKKIMGL